MDANEIQHLSALVEVSKRSDDSFVKLFDEAVRDPAILFSHISGCGVQSGLNCNCSIARMNFRELSALSDAAQSGLDGLDTKPTIQIRLSAALLAGASEKIEYALLSAVYPRLPRVCVLLDWTCRLPTALGGR
jgi:hypothetical protein